MKNKLIFLISFCLIFFALSCGDSTKRDNPVDPPKPKPKPITPAITFEKDGEYTQLQSFGNATAEIADNPVSSDSNKKSLKVTKPKGAETWAGATLLLDPYLDFSKSTIITVKVYSPEANKPILLKIEALDSGDASMELEVNTTKANTWETLSFDISKGKPGKNHTWDTKNKYYKVVVFPNFGTIGDDTIYYFDDFAFTLAPNSPDLPDTKPIIPSITFEEGIDEQYKTPAGFDGVQASVTDNPVSGNAANKKSLKLDKAKGAQSWAGVTIEMEKKSHIDFSNSSIMTLKVYSPEANKPILLKVENNSNLESYVQVSVNVTKANEWETLEFDLSKPSATGKGHTWDPKNRYHKIVVFPDFGTTDIEATYYIDDIKLKQ